MEIKGNNNKVRVINFNWSLILGWITIIIAILCDPSAAFLYLLIGVGLSMLFVD